MPQLSHFAQRIRDAVIAIAVLLVGSESIGGTAANSFRIAKNGNAILLPVDIGSSRHYFVVDTGCTVTVFDARLRSLLGEPTRAVRALTPNGACEMELFVPPTLSIGDQRLEKVKEVSCIDCKFYEHIGDSDGYLGMDAIGTMVMRVDFDRGELSILPTVPDGAGNPVPLYFAEGRPYVRAAAGGLPPALFLVDTGAIDSASGHLNSRLFDSLLPGRELVVVGQSLVSTVARTTWSRDGRLQRFRLERIKGQNDFLTNG